MSYFLTTEDLLTVFQKVNQCLNKNGLFIFDHWNGDKVIALQPEKEQEPLKMKVTI